MTFHQWYQIIKLGLSNTRQKCSKHIREYYIKLSIFDKSINQVRMNSSFKWIERLMNEQHKLITLRRYNKELEMKVDILKQLAISSTQKN